MPDLDVLQKKIEAFQRQVFKTTGARNRAIERVLMQSYREALAAAMKEMQKLYEKAGATKVVDGISITKADAARRGMLDKRIANIKSEMKALEKKGIKLTAAASQQNFQNAYYGAQWATSKGLGFKVGFDLLPVDAIRAAVYSDSSGLTFIKTFIKNTLANQAKTQATIVRGITQGWSFPKMAKEVKDRFTNSMSDSLRVMRTEVTRCYTQGQLEAHRQALALGIIVKKKWVVTKDDRLRDAHEPLDGVFEDENGLFWIEGFSAEGPGLFGVPKLDINERCTIEDVLQELPSDIEDNIGTQPIAGFTEWAKDHGWVDGTGWPKIESTANQIDKASRG